MESDPGPPGSAVSPPLQSALIHAPASRGVNTWVMLVPVSTAQIRLRSVSQSPLGHGWNPAGSWLAAVQAEGTCWLHLLRDCALSRRLCGGREDAGFDI